MKKSSLAIQGIFFAIAAISGTSVFAEEVVVDSGADIEWCTFRKDATTVTSHAGASTTISNLNKDSYAWGYLPYAVKLDVGQSISITATLSYTSKSSSSEGPFYFGIFNSGENSRPAEEMEFSSIVDGTGTMTGFFACTSTNSDGVVQTKVYSRHKPRDGYGFMATTQGKDYLVFDTTPSALSMPVAMEDYVFTIAATRAQNGYDVSVSDGVDSYSMNFTGDKSTAVSVFDVIGFRSPGASMTFSDLSITTTGAIIAIPEPSFLGMVVGFIAIVMVATRRRKLQRAR
ncbi:MAG: hypothetical protein LUD52_03935 [Opitutae bacterium]|nr:hypothetical protein [Opitutae bacterium]